MNALQKGYYSHDVYGVGSYRGNTTVINGETLYRLNYGNGNVLIPHSVAMKSLKPSLKPQKGLGRITPNESASRHLGLTWVTPHLRRVCVNEKGFQQRETSLCEREIDEIKAVTIS